MPMKSSQVSFLKKLTVLIRAKLCIDIVNFFTFTTSHITIDSHSEEAVKNHLPECSIRTYDGEKKRNLVL